MAPSYRSDHADAHAIPPRRYDGFAAGWSLVGARLLALVERLDTHDVSLGVAALTAVVHVVDLTVVAVQGDRG